ncbi:MAG: 1-(5-phosphoribosyl)-5-[(5-phosphoribosylamino)methylideneamino]imidazole-4-carboxamide isomerase [Chloroflexi bacterium]|nr:1-(5-phosphoribosyl)-5-[(5-phosphoribosylamino)methylideneamino]imidazole-4-carboxamide isomerase [Chloroflexota bacterium]
MEVIPAIDLRGGRCVRLYQGDFSKETVFSDDPVAVARRWRDAGARRLHVVDLDGAREGVRVNAPAVERIVRESGLPVQLAGGIRTAAAAGELLSLGIERVVFGTAAVEAPGEVKSAVDALGADRVVIGVDGRDGYVAIKGWTRPTSLTVIDLMRRMRDLGVSRFMFTDIGRDGTSGHPDFKAIMGILDAIDRPIIAAGGIADISDLEQLARMGVEAAVCGKAIYTGAIELAEAIRRVAEISN